MNRGEYERLCIHPIAAYWLADQGMSYYYNRAIVEGSRLRPDFIVPRPNSVLIVECKESAFDDASIIKQLHRYRSVSEKPARLMCLVPVEELNEQIKTYLKQKDISLVGLLNVPSWREAQKMKFSYVTNWPGKIAANGRYE